MIKKKGKVKTARVLVPGLSPEEEGRRKDGAFILVVEGLEASGKNALAFKAPGTIGCFSVDPGTKRAVKRARSAGKEIHVMPVPYSVPTFVPKKEREYWEEKAKTIREEVFDPYQEAWAGVMEEEGFRTVVQDTSTDIWELHRLAHFGKLQQNPQLAYGPVNKEFMGNITDMADAGKMVILLHQLAPEYKDTTDSSGRQKSQATGKLKRLGMNKIAYLADAIVRTVRVEPEYNRVGKVIREGAFEVHIILNKQDPETNGMVLEDPGFADLMAVLDPEVDPALYE